MPRSIVALVVLAALVPIFSHAQTGAVGNRRAELERQLAEFEAQIGTINQSIRVKQAEGVSLERDIAILSSEIRKARLEIRARDLAIEQINSNIGDREELIGALLFKIEREKASLAGLLRQEYELATTPLIEIILGHSRFSGFFNSIDALDAVQTGIQGSFEEIRGTKADAEGEIDALERKKAQELELRALQKLQEARLAEREREKDRLLKITKGEEARYQALLKEREKSAAEIRSELFLLRGSDAIPFEKAVELANFAGEKTGVRPAFILGILAEESNLGENVGTGNWRDDLSHPRCASQRDAFVTITSELGLNPDALPVSKRAWYGYCGGAMGPAQFIPTTWVLFKDAVARVTGHNPPNPWEPKDAFVASALLLRDNGAAAGGYDAERRAALRYLAGSNWRNPAYAFYGDDVMALTATYQKQIDILNRS